MRMTTHKALGRAATVLLMLVPAAACAKPVDQTSFPKRQSATSAAGVTLQDFVKRREGRMLASDTDGDGKVSRAEFLAGAKTGRGDPAKRFAKMDLNEDAFLDKSEIDAMLARRFNRLDANGDGVASTAERSAARVRSTNAAGDETKS